MEEAPTGGRLQLQLRRRTSPQSAALLTALGTVVADQVDGVALARQLGEALAASVPPAESSALNVLGVALNEVLATLDLGFAQLRAEDGALTVEVFDYPAVSPTPRRPELVVIGVLEGFLTHYLNTVSKLSHLTARLERPPASTADPITFVYRDHGR